MEEPVLISSAPFPPKGSGLQKGIWLGTTKGVLPAGRWAVSELQGDGWGAQPSDPRARAAPRRAWAAFAEDPPLTEKSRSERSQLFISQLKPMLGEICWFCFLTQTVKAAGLAQGRAWTCTSAGFCRAQALGLAGGSPRWVWLSRAVARAERPRCLRSAGLGGPRGRGTAGCSPGSRRAAPRCAGSGWGPGTHRTLQSVSTSKL